MRALLIPWLVRFASGLRFPQLFVLVAGLFAVDLIVPDMIPFADEILLALGTLLLGTWKKRSDSGPGEKPSGAPEERG